MLRAASYGLTNEMIGEVWNMHPDTVRYHIGATRIKLGTKSKIHTVAEALRRGLID